MFSLIMYSNYVSESKRNWDAHSYSRVYNWTVQRDLSLCMLKQKYNSIEYNCRALWTIFEQFQVELYLLNSDLFSFY